MIPFLRICLAEARTMGNATTTLHVTVRTLQPAQGDMSSAPCLQNATSQFATLAITVYLPA